MNFIFEILIIAILVGGAYAGVRFGFIKIAAKPMKTVASFFFAFSLCRSVGEGLIAPIIQMPLTSYVKSFLYERYSDLSPEIAMSEIPTLLKMSAAAFNLDVSAMSGMTTDGIIENAVYSFTSPFVKVIAIVFSFVILFIVGKLFIALAINLVQRFCDGGVLALVNKTMGFVLAGFLSVLAAWAFVGATEFVFHLPMFENSDVVRSFSGGILYKTFNSINPLELLLSF